MRKHEITDELVQLSKLAKELGFPQDVEEGDWACEQDDFAFLIDLDIKKMIDYKEDRRLALMGYTLILSFSRCLE